MSDLVSKRSSRIGLLIVLVTMAGCGFKKTSGRLEICCPVRSDPVEFTYLGAGGWSIEAGGEMLLTAPLFSNPGFISLMTGVLDVKEDRIDDAVSAYHLDEALAILVRHGHYDHAMDLPYLVTQHATGAQIYGGRTTRYQLMPFPGLDRTRITAIDRRAATKYRRGRWTRVGRRFRFMPVRSLHTPHTENIHMWQGMRTAPMTTTPKTAHDWLEGETYAYIIDVLDRRGRPQMRIYYNDSASTEPVGFPPAGMKPPDDIPMVGILTAPGHKLETDYPERIIKYMDIDYGLVGHWETFVGKFAASLFRSGTPTTDVGGFVDEMERLMPGAFWVPEIGTEFVFRRR
jgi:hypothetical protein